MLARNPFEPELTPLAGSNFMKFPKQYAIAQVNMNRPGN
jgi:hypothetical protein